MSISEGVMKPPSYPGRTPAKTCESDYKGCIETVVLLISFRSKVVVPSGAGPV